MSYNYLICKCRVCIIFPHRPLLSREIVEKKPHLHGAYLKIEKAFEARGSYNEIKQMTYDLANEIGEDGDNEVFLFEISP